MDLLNWVKNYWPYDEAEGADRAVLQQFLENWSEKGISVYQRENLSAHIVVSCWIVNKNRSKVLMCFHNQYQHWAWLGGHADGDGDLLRVALKETEEESGLKNVIPVSDEPVDICVLYVPMHYKHGKYVSAHLHFNLTYLLEADDTEPVFAKTDENKAVTWVANENVIAETRERDSEPIYQRIMDKIAERKL